MLFGNFDTPNTKKFLEKWKACKMDPNLPDRNLYTLPYLLDIDDMPLAYRNSDKNLNEYFEDEENAEELFKIILNQDDDEKIKKNRRKYLNVIMNLFQATNIELHRILTEHITIVRGILNLLAKDFETDQTLDYNEVLYGLNLIVRIVQRAYDSFSNEIHEVISLCTGDDPTKPCFGYSSIIHRIDIPSIYQCCTELNNEANEGIPVFMWHLFTSLARHLSNDPDIINNVILHEEGKEPWMLRPCAPFLEPDLDLTHDIFADYNPKKSEKNTEMEKLRLSTKVRNSIELLKNHFGNKFADPIFKNLVKRYLEKLFRDDQQDINMKEQVYLQNPRLFILASNLNPSYEILKIAFSLTEKYLQFTEAIELSLYYIASFFSAEGIKIQISSAPSSTPLGLSQAVQKDKDKNEDKAEQKAKEEERLATNRNIIDERLGEKKGEILISLEKAISSILSLEKNNTFILQNFVSLCAGIAQSKYPELVQIVAKSIKIAWTQWRVKWNLDPNAPDKDHNSQLVLPILLEASKELDVDNVEEVKGWKEFMERAVWQWNLDGIISDETKYNGVFNDFDFDRLDDPNPIYIDPEERKKCEMEHKKLISTQLLDN